MDTEISKITKYIFIESKPEKADLVFVFGTRHKEVVLKVFELYKNKLISKILISGGKNRITHENEADMLSQELIRLGIKKEDILLEDESTNSLENVLFSKKVIEEKIGFNNIKKMIVVTKNYHIRRALMTIKKHFPKNIEILPVSYDIGFNKENWFNDEVDKKKVFSEYNKIKEYLEKGDIEDL